MTLTRLGWLLTALATGSVVALGPRAAQHVQDVGSAHFPTALTGMLATGHLAVAVWVLAVVLTSRSSRWRRLLAPAALTRLLVVATTAAVVTAPAATAASDAGPADRTSVAGLRLPDRPLGEVALDARETVEVRPGDTLWAIASAHEGGSATDGQVAEAVRLWHEANREVIGSDPDHIEPGQRLVAPRGVR